jgi:hypothetical protein
MSRDQVFIFVEGRDLDPFVYGQICGPVCKHQNKTYEIVISDRVSGGSGGKEVLALLFDNLQASNFLIDRSASDPKLAMFYLDKDVDDLFATPRVSNHIVYTRHYCIENHIFCEGDLPTSIAIAASLDRDVILARMPDPRAWRERAASLWRDWVALCLVARELTLSGPAGYSANESTINRPADSPVDATCLAAHISDMETRSGLPAADFRTKLTNAENMVDTALRRHEHDSIFKGKWYAKFALREMELASGGNPFNATGAKDRLVGGLIASLDWGNPWVEHFRHPLRTALAAL